MSTSEDRAKHAEYMRGWMTRNREHVNAQQKARYASNQKVRDSIRGRARMTKLRERGGVDRETEDFVPVLLRDPCAYCGAIMEPAGKITPGGASLDHIDPQADSHWTNLSGACSSCNAKKGSLPLLHSLLEQQLRRDLAPIAEQVCLIKGRAGGRRRIEF